MTQSRHPLKLAAEIMAPRALEILLEQCAPELPALVYNPRLPDALFTRLLGWSEALRAAETRSAFALSELPEVFGALNVALLSSWAYAPAANQGTGVPPGRVDLELTDLGGALLVQRTRSAAFVIAMAMHGDAGIALVQQAENDLRQLLDAISAAIARQ